MTSIALKEQQAVSDYIKFDLITSENVIIYSAFSWKCFKDVGRGTLVVETTLSLKKNSILIKSDPKIRYLKKGAFFFGSPQVQNLVDEYDPEKSFLITIPVEIARSNKFDLLTIPLIPKDCLSPEKAFHILRNRSPETVALDKWKIC